jgi:hypothetical protein
MRGINGHIQINLGMRLPDGSRIGRSTVAFAEDSYPAFVFHNSDACSRFRAATINAENK